MDIKTFANYSRCISIDIVDQAKSGHQGLPLGFADVFAVLIKEVMNFSPLSSTRDRLIFSAGHGSALLYSSIFLTQKTNLTLADLYSFRKLGGIIQGHPELNKSLGIEMTTGALGQGIASAVGVAIALKKKSSESKVFAVVGDGDLMEGVSHEAMTLAASLNLNNLIVLFDNNNVCIDSFASNYTADNKVRFQAYGFEVFEANGHDYDEIKKALELAKKSDKPSFISFKTIIGKFSSTEGSTKCHGKFLTHEEIENIKKALSFDFSHVKKIQRKKIPTPSIKEKPINLNDLQNEMKNIKVSLRNDEKYYSTRELAGQVFSRLILKFPNIIGGAADLASSTCTISKNHTIIDSQNFNGNFLNYGVREHAMGCVMNGLALEGFIPYGGTFLVFSDYMRPAIRNAAIMNIPVIFVFTHDSIAIGADGKTHQPIEHLESLRLIPNLKVLRPCCDIEVAESIEVALKSDGPCALILSRQTINLKRTLNSDENLCEKGCYDFISFKNNNLKKIQIVASGAEVELAVKISKNLEQYFDFKVISSPCFELLNEELNLNLKTIFIEAASHFKIFNHPNVHYFDLNDFGESAEAPELFEKFGLNESNIALKLQQIFK